MLQKNIIDYSYVVFDIETTGFNPVNDQIIEIGAVKLDSKGNTVDKFQKFVKLYKIDKLPEKIIELTHIDDSMLTASGEDIDIVMEEFYKFFGNSILVAQNTKFDMSFLDEYYLNKKIFLSNLTLDTIDLAKKIYPGKDTYKLAKLIEYFEVEYDSQAHHRADYDAYITSQIFVKGMKELYNGNFHKFNDYIQIYKIEEATLSQKKYLYSLIKSKEIIIEDKVYLTKFNASRQISILSNKDK